MEPENRGLDLEKELTCSICTEVLYHPLTLLDCLHTFCGSCLKEWFSWQLTSARNSPNSILSGSTPYTCPSCRAPVRDTKHNATVTTLLEMFLAANPDKGKTAEEKEELLKKYKYGEEVLPKVDVRERTLRERRIEDADRRLMNEVRDLSLREVGVESSEARRERRRREHSSSQGTRGHSSRENSRDNRNPEERERRRRRDGESERRHRHEATSLRPEIGPSGERRRRHSDVEARRRHEETSRSAARQIEHQSSLRSLISSSDIDSHEMEEEILRQIREEGLLDGIDLENIDVNQEDQISERIAEAFRRRQDQRSRQEPARRSEPSGRRRRAVSESRETSSDDAPRTLRSRRTHSRSPSAISSGEGQSRPPIASSASQAAHLEIHSSDEGRRRRRTHSSGRSSTTPVPIAEAQTRPAARSQTDLSDRPRSSQLSVGRPQVTIASRSSTDPTVQRTERSESDQTNREAQSTNSSSSRVRPAARPEAPSGTSSPKIHTAPTEVFVPNSGPSAVSNTVIDRSLMPEPLSPRGPTHSRDGSLSDRASAISSGSRPTSSSSANPRPHKQLFHEPSLTCSRCSKPHIEYDLHYNCKICSNGSWNICLSCYRAGRGCLHWFGFGYAAWPKWDKLSQSGELAPDAEGPHMLTANRYVPEKVSVGGADGRRTLTTKDPLNRLQSGAFCANCLAWANECYWRCDFCNEGDWGFCNNCVNQGKSCTHALLPLTYRPTESYASPLSPSHDQHTPASATILTGPGVIDVGPFKPLTFSTKCDICHYPIQPSTTRYHCFSCTSAVPDTQPGDYDICTTCYPKLVASRRISIENGHNGWRRCLQGHRMVIVGFEDNRGGQRRVVVQDLVGGTGLHEEPDSSTDYSGVAVQRWSWGDGACTRLVTTDVSKTAPTTSAGLNIENGFPPDGGIGMLCVALWSWYPKAGADDELLFPKGAEIKEAQDVNGDWFHGMYMGKRGLFPAPFVRVLDVGNNN